MILRSSYLVKFVFSITDELKLMRIELSYNPDATPISTGVDHNRTWNAVDNRILSTDQLENVPMTVNDMHRAEAVGGVDYDGSGAGGEDEEGVELTTQRTSASGTSSSLALRTVGKKSGKKSKQSRSSGEYKALAEEEEEENADVSTETLREIEPEDNQGDDEEVQQQSLLRPVSEVDGHKNKLYANIWKFCLIGMPG